MVVGAFPLFKLASLAIKQISKPIANSLKTTAKQSDFFKKYVCVWSGQGTPNIISLYQLLSSFVASYFISSDLRVKR